jgi:putative ABC transport system ATP-binding protein
MYLSGIYSVLARLLLLRRVQTTYSYPMEQGVVEVNDIVRQYRNTGTEPPAVNGVSLSVEKGEFVGLSGPSGCGKSTLLNIIGLVDAPTRGRVFICGEEIRYGDEAQAVALRRHTIGYIFQQFNLIPTMTALENVMVPLVLNGRGADARQKAELLLEKVGIAGKALAYPSELSGGEMQRVACARAVIHTPEFVIADEPTGNLDSSSGKKVLEILRELAHGGTAVIMATHSESALTYCTRIIKMRDGVMVS